MENVSNITAESIARYFLYRCREDGELITPLKMQKLIYYVYVWTLVNTKTSLFNEKFEAWPNGPVLRSLYHKLKKYGYSPITEDFMPINDEKDLEKLKTSFGDYLDIFDKVYEKYITKSPFELVTLTHNEKPWKRARNGLKVTEPSKNELSDKDILEEYAEKK